MSIQLISPDTVLTPKGHYSPGVIHNGIVYVSGQLPLNKEGKAILDSIEAQVTQCMHNIALILDASGSDFQHILKVSIFISDISFWPKVNETFAQIMGNHKPARIVVPCKEFNYGASVEIECLAAVK